MTMSTQPSEVSLQELLALLGEKEVTIYTLRAEVARLQKELEDARNGN